MKKADAKNDVTMPDGQAVTFSEKGMPNLEVWLEDETIWLTQQQMGVLFGVKENTITYHIKEILSSGELEGIPTTRKFRVVRLEGRRQVTRAAWRRLRIQRGKRYGRDAERGRGHSGIAPYQIDAGFAPNCFWLKR